MCMYINMVKCNVKPLYRVLYKDNMLIEKKMKPYLSVARTIMTHVKAVTTKLPTPVYTAV